jgi:hypothetical protein
MLANFAMPRNDCKQELCRRYDGLMDDVVGCRYHRSAPSHRSANKTGHNKNRNKELPMQATLRIAVAILVLAVPCLHAADSLVASPVATVDDLVRQWTGLEHQNDLLQANWRQDKPVLEQQLVLLEREISELAQVLEASEQEQGAVEQRRLELLQQQTQLEQEQAALEAGLQQASLGLQALQAQLPPPLVEAWSEQLPRLQDPLLNASERLQLVLELLGQLDDFQQKVSLNETIMRLADGNDYLVKQVYLGLSHGWYVTADGRFAAAGMATTAGWRWNEITDTNESAEVGRIIAILERRQSPELISIPLRLDAPAAAGN